MDSEENRLLTSLIPLKNNAAVCQAGSAGAKRSARVSPHSSLSSTSAGTKEGAAAHNRISQPDLQCSPNTINRDASRRVIINATEPAKLKP